MSSTAAIPKPDDVERPSTGALRTLKPIDPSTLPSFDRIEGPSASALSTLKPIDPATLPTFDRIEPPSARPELSAYEPTLWQRATEVVESLLPGDPRAEASNERVDRAIAAREGLTSDRVARLPYAVGDGVADAGRKFVADMVGGTLGAPLGMSDAGRHAANSGLTLGDDSELTAREREVLGIIKPQMDQLRQERRETFEQWAQKGQQIRDEILSTISPAGQERLAGSTPSGNLFKGEFDLGSDPTVSGYALQVAGALGTFLPMLATTLVTKSPTAGAAVGGGLSSGEGSQTARDYIGAQSHEALYENVPNYRALVDSGVDPEQAKSTVTEQAAGASAAYQGLLGALGGRATLGLVFGQYRRLLGQLNSRVGRAAAGLGASGLEEAAQEVGEGVAADIGIAQQDPTKEIGENSVANAVLGFGAGGAIGGTIGATTSGDPQAALGRAMQAELDQEIENPAAVDQQAREQMQPPTPTVDRSPIEGAELVHAPGPLGRAAARAEQQQAISAGLTPLTGASATGVDPAAEPTRTGTAAPSPIQVDGQASLGADLTGLDADLAGLERRDPQQAAAELDARLAEADPGGRDAEQALIQAAMTELATLNGPAAQARVEALKQELAELQVRRAQALQTQTPPVVEGQTPDYGAPVVGTVPTPDAAVELTPERVAPDIARQDGTPFPDADTAERARVNRRLGEEYAPAQTDGGWVLRQAPPTKTTPTPSITRDPEGDEIVAIEDDPRLKNPDTREQVRALAQAAGWSEEGGRVIRDAGGQVTGRTRWIPRYPFWEDRPDGVTKAVVDAAVEKFEAGKPLNKPERAALRFLTDTATVQDWVASEEDTLDHVADIEQSTADLAELRARYEAAFDDVVERVAVQVGDNADQGQFAQALARELEAMMSRGQPGPAVTPASPGGPDGLALTGESQADLEARRQADAQRARDDAARLNAEDAKRMADGARESFNLSPVETNPEAQQAADRGQMGMDLGPTTAQADQWPVNDATAQGATEKAPDGAVTAPMDQQPADQRANPANDFRVFPELIQEALSARGELATLHRAAGVRGADAFNGLPIDDRARAYAAFVQAGGEPVAVPSDYNAWVREEYRKADQRRRDNEDPRRRRYTFDDNRAQSEIVAEMGLQEDANGELIATDEQFAELNQRLAARRRGEAPATPARLDTDIARTNGQPFKDEKTARTAAKNRRLVDVEPVQVDGGWVLRGADTSAESTPETGPFGPIFRQFRHDAKGAIDHLKQAQTGEAVAALHHPEVGDIDLVWGKEGTARSDGSGLAKLIKWHPEVVDDLQGFMSSLKVLQRDKKRVQLWDGQNKRAVVKLTFDEQRKQWLLTAYEKGRTGGATSPDTDALGGKGDTARLSSSSNQSLAAPAPDGKAASTIEVDGIPRPATNSEGRPIHPTEEGVRNFWQWFGDSRVTNEQGAPLTVYHGTSHTANTGEAFTFFDAYGSNYGLFGQGAYFTADPEIAASYTQKGKGSSPTVYPAYLSIRRPIDMDAEADAAAWRQAYPDLDIDAYHEGGTSNESYYRAVEEALIDEGLPRLEAAETIQDGLRQMGHDGITHIGGGRVQGDGKRHRVFIAFDPEQVKSATGNDGTFSSTNPDIRFSLTPQRPTGERLSANFLRARLSDITRSWPGLKQMPVKVVDNERGLPKSVQTKLKAMRAQGAETIPRAVYVPGDGLYFVAGNIASVREATLALAEEAIGHHGLRAVMGPQFEALLDRVISERRADVEAMAADYGLDMANREQALEAADEFLSKQARLETQETWLQGIVQAIRAMLRKMGVQLRLSDGDIRALLAASNRYVTQGDTRGVLKARERFGGKATGRNQAARLSMDAGRLPETIDNDERLRALLKQYAGVEGAPSEAELTEAVRQYREVERANAEILRAHDKDGAPLPAPNGEPSNLNREQWILVRTPNFKRWFGNWLYRENQPVTVTRVERDANAPSGNEARAWREYVIGMLRGQKAKIADNGVTVEFFRGGLEASLKNRNRDARALYARLPDILSNAVYLGYAENSKQDAKPGVVGYEHYVAAVELDGQVREVSLTVDLVRDAARGRGYYYHQIGDVDVGDAVGYSRALEAPASSLHTIKVGDLRTFDKPFPYPQAIDANGEPLVVYHGSPSNEITAFDASREGENTGAATDEHGLGGHYFTNSPDVADTYARTSEVELSNVAEQEFGIKPRDGLPRSTVYPAYLSLNNPLRVSGIVTRRVVEAAKSRGHDGVIASLGGQTEYLVFDPTQIKSAIGNTGAFDGTTPDIRFSRSGTNNTDPVLAEARRKAGLGPRLGFVQRVRASLDPLFEAVTTRREETIADLRQGWLDQFHGIRRAEQRNLGNLPTEQSAYVAARLATGTASVMRAVLLHGRPRWADNRQHLEKIQDTQGLLDILRPLGNQLDDWIGWMVGNRAARLMQEGRENNFTPEEIAALRDLGKGNLDLFRETARQFAAFKRSILDVAEGAGLIDPHSRAVWDHADWIPFYRNLADQDATLAPRSHGGLANQSSGIRTLRGGQAALNDPMENIIMNFHHLLDASLKNNAVRKAIAAAPDAVEKLPPPMQQVAVSNSEVKRVLKAQGVPDDLIKTFPPQVFEGISKLWSFAPPNAPDIIRVMEDGKATYYRVTDPLLLKAVTSFESFDMPGLATARAFKRLFTGAVTASPEFMIRNFLRDTASTAIISRSAVDAGGALRGIAQSLTGSGAAEQMLFAGASFASGYIDGTDPEAITRSVRRSLRARGMSASATEAFIGSLVDTPAKFWDTYRQINEAVENANREAVFAAVEGRGGSVTEAAFESKDLMDFSLRGSSKAYRLLADVVPFFNARVQGLYRLGRTDPKQLVRRGLMLAVPSILLAMANLGDDDYEDLPDWDKDLHWHLWIGDEHFRVPKPFEVGLIFGTVPERMVRYLAGQDEGKRLLGRLWWGLSDTLHLVDWPQVVKPAVEVAYNWDSFRGRPIESLAETRYNTPSQRYSGHTSETLREIVQAGAPVFDKIGLSPKKAEHLVGGYLGTMGLWGLSVVDLATRMATDAPERPTWRADDIPLLRILYRGDRSSPARNTQAVEDVYKAAQLFAQMKGDITDAGKRGDREQAQQILERHRERLELFAPAAEAAEYLTDASKQINAIYADRSLTPEQKRKRVDVVLARRNEIARRAAELMRTKR